METRAFRNHELAVALWRSGWYEARMLAAFVDDPALVTPAQMDRQARDFANWAICHTLCFHLYDRTPHAWGRRVNSAAGGICEAGVVRTARIGRAARQEGA